MNQVKVSLLTNEIQAIVDAVENVGILDAPVIRKLERAMEDVSFCCRLEGRQEVELSLWPREIQDIKRLTQKGKLWHPEGDTFINNAIAKMEEALKCGSTQENSADPPAS